MCCTLPDSSGGGLTAPGEPACCPKGGNTVGRLCCSDSMAPLPLRWGTVSGVGCCVGEGTRRARRAYHRKVSAVEPPPGVSGLTSTLTQATFSWLVYKEEDEGRRSEQSYGGAIVKSVRLSGQVQCGLSWEQHLTTHNTPRGWKYAALSLQESASELSIHVKLWTFLIKARYCGY